MEATFLDIDPADVVGVDPADPAVRVSFAFATAEHAARTVNLAAAQKVAAIRSVMIEARHTPVLWAVRMRDQHPDEFVEFAIRGAAEDLAVRLQESPQSIRSQEWEALTVIRRAPTVWAAFQDGDIPVANFRVVAEYAASLPDDDPRLFAAYDAAILDAATTLPPARFRPKARALREKLCAETGAERHRRAVQDRRAWLEPELDGMATLIARLPADVAVRAMAGIDAEARQLRAMPGEARTLAQIRADLIGDYLIGPPGNRSVGVKVAVTVPVLTLLGQRDDPGTIDGYGPIDADTARALAGEATSFIRILTHPVTGTVMDIDRRAYAVPTDMSRYVKTTRPQCDFLGCGRPADGCDLDHTVAWADGGSTAVWNLTVLCRDHHRVKHNTKWRPTWDTTGRLHWTSPTGRARRADSPPWDLPASLP